MKNNWKSDLLNIENAKTIKGESLGYKTGVLYLAPAKEAVPFGAKNTCPYASKGCAAACLYTAGRGRFNNVQSARIAKTVLFWQDRPSFMAQLHKSISKLIKSAEREGLTPCIRLNGTSDIGWQKLGIFEQYPDVQFYDYTKGIKRLLENDHANYHLTFSRSESNHKTVERVLSDTDTNVAAVFSTKRNDGLPTSYMGRRVIDGDLHDLRFLDTQNCIVGLRAKGDAKQDQSGFVIHA